MSSTENRDAFIASVAVDLERFRMRIDAIERDINRAALRLDDAIDGRGYMTIEEMRSVLSDISQNVRGGPWYDLKLSKDQIDETITSVKVDRDKLATALTKAEISRQQHEKRMAELEQKVAIAEADARSALGRTVMIITVLVIAVAGYWFK